MTTLRPATADDLHGLEAVIDATGLFPSTMLGAMMSGALDGSAPEDVWVVADRGAGPAGLAYCAPEHMARGTWNVLLVAVRPERQGQGIGGALMERVEATARGRGGRVLLVETSGLPAFAGTRAFYRGLGFREEARIRDFYAAGEDKVVFWKDLSLTLRPARPDDVPALQAVEADAARAYAADPGTRFCVDLPARDAAEHARARERGLALVAEVGGRPVGFLLALPADGRAHLLEVAVGRDHQGRGYGRRLISAFEAWARRAGFGEATLTTFRDVAWNAPFYGRLGYGDVEVGPGRADLAGIVEAERRAGFHRASRVAMRKPLSRPG